MLMCSVGLDESYSSYYYYYYYYYYSDYSYYEDECAKFGAKDCEVQQKFSCSWRYDKCQKKVPGHSFNFTGYKVATFKMCDPKSIYFESDQKKKGGNLIKTAKECVHKCNADPQCAAAEWYRINNPYCYLSNNCTLDNAIASRRMYREQSFLFVKQNFTKKIGTDVNQIML